VSVAPSAERFARRRGLPSHELAAGISPAIMAGLRRIAGHRNEHGSIVGWQLETSQPQGSGATVRFTGPNNASSTLQLLVSDAGKVSGKWAFGPGDEQAKRKLAMAVTQLLRPPARAAGSAAGVGAAAS
jgi:hypothetical protein